MTLFSPAESSHVQDPIVTTFSAAGRRITRGRLELQFAADGEGQTYLGRQHSTYPFHICRTHFHDTDHPGLATLYVQSCSGGLYEDDHLDIRIVARAATEAHVSTQASTIVHGMRLGSAHQDVRIEAHDGCYLEYLPDAQILFPNSRCSSTIHICMSDRGAVLVSDSFLVHDPKGSGEHFSAYFSEIVITNGTGRTLAIDRLNLDGQLLHKAYPGVTGSFKAQGTLVVASLESLPQSMVTTIRHIHFDNGEAAIGASLLPNAAGVLVRILAIDGAALKQATHACWCAARIALKGALPAPRRK